MKFALINIGLLILFSVAEYSSSIDDGGSRGGDIGTFDSQSMRKPLYGFVPYQKGNMALFGGQTIFKGPRIRKFKSQDFGLGKLKDGEHDIGLNFPLLDMIMLSNMKQYFSELSKYLRSFKHAESEPGSGATKKSTFDAGYQETGYGK